MSNNEFGGDWTEEKLTCLSKYLEAYTTLFKNNIKAQYFTTNYVDAFAGTGYIYKKSGNLSNKQLDFLDEDLTAESYIKGSTERALSINNHFDNYIFIEKDEKKLPDLYQLKDKFANLSNRIRIVNQDANTFLVDWCKNTDWKKNRAVVFLDPYGMQVNWKTVEAIGQTKAIDLWWLFPLGIGATRLLCKNRKPSDANAQKLTETFGSDTWKEAFYKCTTQQTLFSEYQELTKREADLNVIGRYTIDRLRTIFCDVLPDPLILYNSKNNPMYIFCFAVGNERGSGPALNIAKSIISYQISTKRSHKM